MNGDYSSPYTSLRFSDCIFFLIDGSGIDKLIGQIIVIGIQSI